MKTNALFNESVNAIPQDLKYKFDLSFAISDKIANTLKEKGMSKIDLAKKMNKKPSEISKWLRGNHNFTLFTIAEISSALDTTLIKVL